MAADYCFPVVIVLRGSTIASDLAMRKALPVNRTPRLQALGLRPFHSSFFLFAFLLLLFPALAARAQNPGMHPGQSDNFPATFTSNNAGWVGYGAQSVGTWSILSPTNSRVADSNSPNGWSVSYSPSTGFSVTCPNLSSLAGTGYTATYCKSYKITVIGDSDIETDSGPAAAFDVSNPPAKPGARPGPAYGWEASVAGVNLANGNKLTSIPIVGWKQRGGLPVDFTLYHSSEAGWTGWCGVKWTCTEDAVLSSNTQTVTVRWGDGTTYSFTLSGSAYVCNQRGIHDTLTGSGTAYDILTQDQTKYHFSSKDVNGSNFGNGFNLVSVTDRNGNAVTISRVTSGQIYQIQDCTGRTISLGYDGQGRISTVTDPLNRQWVLGYDGSNNLSTITLPSLNGQSYSTQLGYDGNHNINSITSPGKRTTTAYYNGDNSVQWIKDALGYPLSFGYSATATTVTDANNHATTYNFLYGTVASVTDPLGKTASTVFDINNALAQSTDRRGHSSYTTPDPRSGTSLNTTDADGNTTSAAYNGSTSYVSSTTDANNKTTRYSYVGNYNLSQVLDPLSVNANALTDYPAIWYGLPDWTRDANSHMTTFGYDNNPAGSGGYTGGYGILTSTTDPNGITNTSHYGNALGWVDWTTDNQQHRTSFVYDNWGRVVQTTAPDGTVTTTEYDPDGNVLSVDGGYWRDYLLRCGQGAGDTWGADGWYSGGGSAATTNAIDTRLVSIPAPPSVYQSERNAPDFTYSLPNLYPGRVYTVRLHFAETNNYRPGDRVFSISINGQTVLPAFDILAAAGAINRAVIREFAAKADGNGFLTIRFQHVSGGDPNAKVDGIEIIRRGVSNLYDTEGRLYQSTDGRGNTVTYTYDQSDTNNNRQLGLLSWKTDGAGHTTRYSYTSRNELASAAYANGTSESWGYDENGNLQTYTRPEGSVITYQHDNNNLLLHILYQNTTVNHNVDFTYDADNRRQTMADGIGNWRWDYDADGRLTLLTMPTNTIGYNYYPANAANYRGLLASRTEGNGVGAWNYTTYDNDDNLIAMVNPFGEQTLFHYDTLNRRDQVQNAIHQWTTYGFDALSRTQSIAWGTSAGDTSTGWENYAYDPAGALVQKDQNDGSTTRYGYDGAGQITWEQRAGGNAAMPAYAESYTYDGNSNRLSKMLTDATHAGAVDWYTYQPNSDRLDHVSGGIVGSRAYTYDANGTVRRIDANGQSVWLSTDYNGMPIRMDFNTGAGAGSVYSTMTYNGLNQRSFYHDAGGVNHYNSYDGAEPGAALLSDSINVYTPGISQHSGATGQSRYFVTDGQGSLRGLHDPTTTMTDDVRFDAFGQQDFHGGSAPSALPLAWHQSSNYQTDNDSGLMLLGNRYYDSVVGRFLSPDKVHDGNNWYAYCGNDPLGGVDPSGNVPQTINGSGYGSAIGVSMMGGAGPAMADLEYDYLSGLADKYNSQVDANKSRIAQAASIADSLFTFGTGGKLVAKYDAYRQGKASTGSLITSLALFGLAAAANFIPGEEEANLAAHAGEYLAKDAIEHVTPGIRALEGVHLNGATGRVEPWKAYYDEYGRIIGRTDYNAGNKAAGIPSIHHHLYEYSNTIIHRIKGHPAGEFRP